MEASCLIYIKFRLGLLSKAAVWRQVMGATLSLHHHSGPLFPRVTSAVRCLRANLRGTAAWGLRYQSQEYLAQVQKHLPQLTDSCFPGQMIPVSFSLASRAICYDSVI